MQLNQIPTQSVTGEMTALDQRIAEQSVNAMPEEPEPGAMAKLARDIPAPVLWAGALFLALTLMGRKRR